MLKASAALAFGLLCANAAAANSFGNPDDAPYEVCAHAMQAAMTNVSDAEIAELTAYLAATARDQ